MKRMTAGDLQALELLMQTLSLIHIWGAVLHAPRLLRQENRLNFCEWE